METPLHAPPPVGHGVYWAIRQDWRRPVFIGAGFLALVVLGLIPHFHRLDRQQKETFAEVRRLLITENLHDLPTQRACVLSRADNVFYWRGLAWKREQGRRHPMLFAVRVEASPLTRTIDSQIIPYDQRRAESLGVFVEIPE